jgi:hypothetical protein
MWELQKQRRTQILALKAVHDFSNNKFDEAIDTFIELDLNPAKVLALYPESVAGRLSVPSERWIALYGGPTPSDTESRAESESVTQAQGTEPEAGEPFTNQEKAGEIKGEGVAGTGTSTLLEGIAGSAVAESIRGRLGGGLGTGLSAGFGAMMRSANPAALVAQEKGEGSVPPVDTPQKRRQQPPGGLCLLFLFAVQIDAHLSRHFQGFSRDSHPLRYRPPTQALSSFANRWDNSRHPVSQSSSSV